MITDENHLSLVKEASSKNTINLKNIVRINSTKEQNNFKSTMKIAFLKRYCASFFLLNLICSISCQISTSK
jgi:hypothetical protein